MTTLFQTQIINSYIIKLFLSFCLLAFSYISPILAQKDSVNSSNYLLIINSYTEAAPWSFRMISAITEYAQMNSDRQFWKNTSDILRVC